MDTFSSFFEQRSRNMWNENALKNLNALTPAVQKHLQKVYATLSCSILIAAFGVLLDLYYGLGGILSTLGAVGSTVWLAVTPPSPAQENKRLGLLAATALFQGLTLGNLVEVAMSMDASLVAAALLGTVCIFACFTGAALLARRREYLYLGAIISSALSVMATLRFASLFVGGSATMFQVELYGGLLVFVGYVLFDTQMIVERASLGDKDYIRHSLDLFVDFVAIFVRILLIVMKNSRSATKTKRAKSNKQRTTRTSYR